LVTIHGTRGRGNDTLIGTKRKDTIDGRAGNDTITGGKGPDVMTGGKGNDVFVYNSIDDSPVKKFDTITDFKQGADKIDLRPLLGATDLIFGGTTPTPNGVWFQRMGGKTFVFADVTGDNTPDLKIQLNGTFTLTSADFLGVAGEGNHAPVAVNDTLTATEDTAVIYTAAQLLGNDTDVELSTLSIASVTSGTGGTAVLNANGTVTFTPNVNFNGPAAFSYTASDGTLPSNTATVTVNVTAVNDAPVATDDGLASVAEDSGTRTITFAALTGNDSDGDPEVVQTLTITAVSNAVGGTVAIVSGHVEFTPDANFNGAASFAYTVQDNGQTNGTDDFKPDTGSVSFDVTAVNDAPVATDDGLASVAEDSGTRTITFAALTGNDSDGDPEVVQTLTITAVSNAVGGTVAIVSGHVEFTPDANFNGAASFAYTVQDNGQTNGTDDFKPDTGSVSFDVTAVNDAPTVSATAASGITEALDASAQDLLGSGVVNFDDIDTTDVVGISSESNGDIAWNFERLGDYMIDPGLAAALVAGFSVTTVTDAAVPGSTPWTYSVADTNLDFLAAGETITFSYTVTATDNANATATDMVRFKIIGTNDAPVFSLVIADGHRDDSDAVALTKGIAPLSTSGKLTVNDVDLLDQLTPTVVSVAASGTTTGLGSDEAVLLAMLEVGPSEIGGDPGDTHNFSWMFKSVAKTFDYLEAGQFLTLTYRVRATDDSAVPASVDHTVTITIKGSNVAPVANDDIVLTNIPQGDKILIPAAALLANDTDFDNDPLRINVANAVATEDTVAPAGAVRYTDNIPLGGSFKYKAFDGTAWSGFASVIVGTQVGATVTGTVANEILIGSAGHDTLNGNGGNDIFIGGLGQDTVIGGFGNDTYVVNPGDGQDTISESAGNSDRLLYGATINPLDLVISRQANDLRIAVYGSTDQVTIQNWFGGTDNQVETIQAGNGQTLLSTQVDGLIQAMAQFSANHNGLTWDQGIAQKPQEVQEVLAASWQ